MKIMKQKFEQLQKPNYWRSKGSFRKRSWRKSGKIPQTISSLVLPLPNFSGTGTFNCLWAQLKGKHMNKLAGPHDRSVATLNYLSGNNDLEKPGGKHIGATSGQSDRPAGPTPGVAGQLATAGGLPTWFLHQQVPGSHDTRRTCCQDAVIHTHIHTHVWSHPSKGLRPRVRVACWCNPWTDHMPLWTNTWPLMPGASLIPSLARHRKRRCHLVFFKCLLI